MTLSDVEVQLFYNSVGFQIVSADPNVVDLVLFCEVFDGFDECRAVVGNDIGH